MMTMMTVLVCVLISFVFWTSLWQSSVSRAINEQIAESIAARNKDPREELFDAMDPMDRAILRQHAKEQEAKKLAATTPQAARPAPAPAPTAPPARKNDAAWVHIAIILLVPILIAWYIGTH